MQEKNGCAERKYRHIVELGRTLLTHDSVPYSYWTYVFNTFVYTINRLPSFSNQSTPFELLFHTKPNYDELMVFGSLCYPWLKPYTSHKLAPRSSSCVFWTIVRFTKGIHILKFLLVECLSHVMFCFMNRCSLLRSQMIIAPEQPTPWILLLHLFLYRQFL